MTSCQICLCDFELNEKIILCDNKHLFCTDCIERYLTTIAINDKIIIDHYDKHEYLKCSLCDTSIDEDSILNSSIRKQYIKSTRNISNTIVSKKTELLMIKSNTSFSTTLISEIKDILTNCISCPYCNQPFIDFSGCLALKCSFCSKQFCGFCMKKHLYNSDTHSNVSEHINALSDTDKNRYGSHSNYFISKSGWIKLSNKIKCDSIIEYLSKIRIDVVWKSLNDIITILKKEELLPINDITNLEEIIYSHDTHGVHLLRIPIIFWTIYSSKNNCKIEDVIQSIELSVDNRINIGKYVIDRVRSNYPNWKAIKHQIPGETFLAVNYPPELSSIIFSAITEWGILNKHWK